MMQRMEALMEKYAHFDLSQANNIGVYKLCGCFKLSQNRTDYLQCDILRYQILVYD